MSPGRPDRADAALRIRIEWSGRVQGIGLRPALHRLAEAAQLTGFVCNTSSGVLLEIEGPPQQIKSFEVHLHDLRTRLELTAPAVRTRLAVRGDDAFLIAANEETGPPGVAVPPDRKTCAECQEDFLGTCPRREGYPFVGCTRCGPRWTVLTSLPFERRGTTFGDFPLCPACRTEFTTPATRWFHAETLVCRKCGPMVAVNGAVTGDWLQAALACLRGEHIVALLGLGGFQLLCDATSSAAVAELRGKKQRIRKPFAVLVANEAAAERLIELSAQERAALAHAANPIVIGQLKSQVNLAHEVTWGLATLGVLLPATPLHAAVAAAFQKPLVCTSANCEGEPLYFRHEDSPLLSTLADAVISHQRRLARPVDDSVVQVIGERELSVRLARGKAPLPLNVTSERRALALGGQQKVALAWSNGKQAVLGPHLGDLATTAAHTRFEESIADIQRLYQFIPELLIHDGHPDYFSTRWAVRQSMRTLAVQHHHAHVAAAMLEAGWLDRQVLGIAWDGTGYGLDGTIWGGEFLLATASSFERVGHLRTFPLVGGDLAVREPWRVAAVLLAQTLGESAAAQHFPNRPVVTLLAAAKSPRLAATCSSMGRFLDGVGCLLLCMEEAGYDGEVPQRLEDIADRSESGAYPLPWHGTILDWHPLMLAALEDMARKRSPGVIAMRLHRALARAIIEAMDRWSTYPVVVTGGVFQNRLLLKLVLEGLRDRGELDRLSLPGQIPVNDGGLAAGQLAIGLAKLSAEGS